MPSSAEPAPLRRRLDAAAWPATALALALASIVATLLGNAAALDHATALVTREPWRLWTAAWVHLSALHLAANVAGALLVGALGAVAKLRWRWTAAWLVAWPLTQLGLLLKADLDRYAGLSGMLHAGVAIAGVALVANGAGSRRIVGASLLAGTAVKVVLEAPWREAIRHLPGWDIPIVPFAHASGLVAGIAAGALVLAASHLRPAAGSPRATIAR